MGLRKDVVIVCVEGFDEGSWEMVFVRRWDMKK